jgi:signal transduction histidine kinase/Tfp pilus assembly protein PilF
MRFFKILLVFTFCALLFSISSFSLYAQSADSLLKELYKAKNKDDLISIYNELGNKLRYAYPDSAMLFYKQGLIISQLQKNEQAEADAIRSMGTVWAIKNNYDSAIYNIQKSIRLNKKNGNNIGIAKSFNSIALVYMKTENLDLAKANLIDAIKLGYELGDSILLSKTFNNMGLLYKRKNDFDSALYYYHESMKIKDEIGDSPGVGRTANNIALIYEEISEFDLALKYLNQSYAIRKSNKNEYGMAVVLNNYGLVYESQGELKLALENYLKSKRVMQRLNKVDRLATLYNNIGSVHIKLKQYKTGYDNLNKALKINKDIGNVRGQLITTIELAKFFENLKIHQNAVMHYRRALKYSNNVEDIARRSEIHEGLYNAYEMLGKFDSALYFYKIYTHLNDSIFNTYSRRNIEKLEVDFQTLKKEKENQELVQSNQIKEEKLKRAFLGGILLLVVLAFIIVFSLFSVTSRRKLEKTYQLVLDQRNNIQQQSSELSLAYKKLQEFSTFKEELTGMIVHDLKNPLNIILNVSEIKNYPDKDQVVLQSGKQMMNLVMNILDVYKYEDKKFRLEPQKQFINPLIEKVKSDLSFVLSEKSIRIKTAIDYDFLVNFDEIALERVIVNLLTNAIKFSPQGSVIQINTEPLRNNRFRLHVIDSGEGIPKEGIHQIFKKFEQRESVNLGYSGSTGIGLTYCKMAIEAHNGIIAVESIVGKGADFYIELDYNETRISEIIEPDVKGNYLVLSRENRGLLYPFIISMQKKGIYEVTEIRNILKMIKRDNAEMQKFCNLIESSVLNCNQVMYDELLELALSKE